MNIFSPLIVAIRAEETSPGLPAIYKLPKFSDGIQRHLQEKMPVDSAARREIVQTLFDDISKYTL